MKAGWLGLLIGSALLLAGCGGSQHTGRGSGSSTSTSETDGQLDALASGWKTDFGRHTVPLSAFPGGGPGKDGIPALDHPRFGRVAAIDFLKPQEPVIELVVKGDARAYPLQILIWHEIADDRVGGVPVAVTFCPLCNTAIVFDRRVRGRTLSFGTTGNLRNSDLVMYDRQTESWWQQLGGAAVVGRYAGTHLRQLPARIVSWRDFARRYPKGLVLTRNTGFNRAYGENPYTGYDDVGSPPFFPTAHQDDKRLPPKERVVFVEIGGKAAAVPFSVLASKREVRFELAGHALVTHFRGEAASALDQVDISQGRRVGTAEVLDEQGRLVPFSEPFWFAVAAFQPDVVLERG